jgi:zinc/manganese transport system substrate-binding protein
MRVIRMTSVVVAAAGAVAGCGGAAAATAASPTASAAGGQIVAVGAENEYANVIQQIGGKYVTASAVMSNPNTDPHTFEASAEVARTVGQAQLVVQNGLGYDDFMSKIEAAAPNSSRKVVDVQTLLGLPDSTANPHLWYSPKTMPAVATALATDLAQLDPAHKAYFHANARRFDKSLRPWLNALATFKKQHHVAVATTEPVADYMLQAAGVDNKTPFTLQAAIMNGTDPSPQDVTLQSGLFNGRKVKAFVYNQQVTDTITQNFLKLAAKNHIPVIGVYETMPTDGYTYQSWMMAELNALKRAVTQSKSTTKL